MTYNGDVWRAVSFYKMKTIFGIDWGSKTVVSDTLVKGLTAEPFAHRTSDNWIEAFVETQVVRFF